jgi:hypothetical protein
MSTRLRNPPLILPLWTLSFRLMIRLSSYLAHPDHGPAQVMTRSRQPTPGVSAVGTGRDAPGSAENHGPSCHDPALGSDLPNMRDVMARRRCRAYRYDG